jgi:hypothetical protein
LWQCDKFWGAELHINSSTLEIVRVSFSSPAATTFPLPIYHTTTTMSREALRLRNLNVNYLPPPLILSSPPSSPKNVKKQSAKHHIMDDHSGQKHTSCRPPLPPTVVQHRLVIIPDVSSPTTEAPPAMLNLDDNYSSSDEAYIEPARSITADHSVKRCKKTLKKPSQNLTDLSELPTFNPLQPIVPPHKVWNRLPISFSELDAITPIKIFNYFRSGAVNDGVATLLWMDSSPVTMMSTIHPLSGEDSLVLRMRKHPGNKSTNASGANSTFPPGER